MMKRRILHIVSDPDDPLPEEIVREQKAQGTFELSVVDLSAADLDRRALLIEIFKADSVQVW